MKKDLDFKLVVWLLVTVFIISAPVSVYSMDTIKSKAQWVKTKAARMKEKTLDRLVKQYRDTQELRRKKAEGIATPAELKVLQRRMRNIQRVAVAIGVTLATIAAIAGGTVAYREYRKKERRMLAEKEGGEAAEAIASARAERVERIMGDIERQAKGEEKASKGDYSLLEWDEVIQLSNIPIREVKKRLDGGADPNQKDSWGHPPLFHVIENNRGDLVDLLVRAGADPNFELESRGLPEDKHTLIMKAVRDNNYRMVYKLLQNGADPRRGPWGGAWHIARHFPVDDRIVSLIREALVEWDKPSEQKLEQLQKEVGLPLPLEVQEMILGKKLTVPSVPE